MKITNLTMEELYLREEKYIKAVQTIKHNISIPFEELGLMQYRLKTNRYILKPIFGSINLYSVFKFYINLGIVLKDKNKRLYMLEEVEEKIIQYYKKHNIDYEV